MHPVVRTMIDLIRRRVGYAGGTTTLGDAWVIWRALRNGVPLADGTHVLAYEQSLARYLGTRHAFTYGAGRMATYALLKAMGLGEGDEIILPGYNCVVIPNAVRFAGVTPVYVDIRADNFNMDPGLAERAITPRTKAIVIQHTFGIPCDMDAFLDLGRRKGLPLIEDCAHALGGRWDGRQLGTIGYAGFYSTEATKMFSTEKGGILVTDDVELGGRLQREREAMPWRVETFERAMARRFALRCLSGEPWCNIPLGMIYIVDGVSRIRVLHRIEEFDGDDYRRELAGQRSDPYPCRLGNVMALAGKRQLDRIDENLAHRRMLANECERILPRKGARIARYDARRAMPSWVRFPFVVDDRVAWSARLTAAGLSPGKWLNDPIHPAGCNTAFAMYRRGSCPVAEKIAETIVNVPVHSRVSLRRIRRLEHLPDAGIS